MTSVRTIKSLTLAAAATLLAFNAFAAETTGAEAPAAAPAVSDTKASADAIDQLQKQLDDLRQKLAVVERKSEIKAEEDSAKAKDTAAFTFDENGFKATSADKNFQLRVRGLIQTDARVYFDQNDPANKTNDSFILRRVRPIIEATIAKDYDAVFVPEFGGSYGIGAASSSIPAPVILDAYLNAKIVGENVQLRVGKFKSPIGLDLLQEDANRPLIESGFPTYLVPNRDVGIQLHGNVSKGLVSYQLGVFNGTPDGSVSTDAPDFGNNKDVVARIFLKPFVSSSNEWINNLGFGVAADYGDKDGSTTNTGLTSGYKTDGSQTFFAYNAAVHTRGASTHLAPQASWYVGPFSLLGEYIFSDTDVVGGTVANRLVNVGNRAWEVTAGYVLTGEDAAFTGVRPENSVLNGGFGAWEIVARASQIYIDNDVFTQGLASAATNASGAKSYDIGLNWYLSRNLRVSADYTHTDFASAPTTTPVLRNGENAILLRAQVAF